MHGPIRDRLEDLLRDHGRQPVSSHLRQCAECASELAAMRQHSAMLATLRAPETDPAAGFYARVIQRIEESEFGSFWAFFVDSTFSKRLAFASLTIAVALGTYVVSEESHEHPQTVAATMAFNSAFSNAVHYDVPVTGNQAQQRDAVLQNFAVHLAPVSQGQIQ